MSTTMIKEKGIQSDQERVTRIEAEAARVAALEAQADAEAVQAAIDAVIRAQVRACDRRGNYTATPLTGRGQWLEAERDMIAVEFHRLNQVPRPSRMLERAEADLSAIVARGEALGVFGRTPEDMTTVDTIVSAMILQTAKRARKVRRMVGDEMSRRLEMLTIIREKATRLGVDLGSRTERLNKARARFDAVA